MFDKEKLATYIEDLALVAQDSAERGTMNPSVYVNILELIGVLASALRMEEARAA